MSKNKITAVRVVSMTAALVCMITIFCFSAQKAVKSNEVSGSVLERVLSVLVKDYDELPDAERTALLNKYGGLIRKIAHFGIYTVLGFFVCLSFSGTKFRYPARSGMSLAICILYAAADEIHQYFVPGRSCQFGDVLIDGGGAFLGILLAVLITAALVKLSKKEKKTNKNRS